MSKKDQKKDVSHIEEIDLNTIMSPDAIFDLGKIREKAILSKDISTVTLKEDDIEDHNDGSEEHHDDLDLHPHELDEMIEDDLLPLKDEDLLLLEDDLGDFEDMDEDDEE